MKIGEMEKEGIYTMNNKQVAKTLHYLGDLLEVSGENAFRVSAYRRAARALENSKQSITDLDGSLTQINGIGKGMAQVITEILQTGTTERLEELKNSLPPGLIELLQLSGIGPKTIYTLYKELDITDLTQLQAAAEQEQIRPLKGFGPKKEQKILESIKRFQERPDRVLLSDALQLGNKLVAQLEQLPGVQKIALAGSVRRRKETIKDIDIIIATTDATALTESLTTLPEIKKMLQSGPTKVNLIAQVGTISLSVDIRFVTLDQFASTLHHFTGSTAHNIRIRQIGKSLGLKVNEYGIEDTSTGETLTFDDETAFFAKLGLAYVPPELREDRGEIEAATTDQIPDLLTTSQYVGDLHTHSLYSDGAHSIQQMARVAKSRGYQYLAITDHSRSLRVASGLSIAELQEQWAEIDRINAEIDDFQILKGSEVDILTDGTLDYPDEILAQLDLVVASIHTSFQLSEAEMTKRLIRAIENPYVHIIGHPTGRLLLRRDAYALDIDAVFRAAQDTGTILELNANPYRLDLHDKHLQLAKEEYELKFSINTDAHATEQLALLPYGIGTARRGWLTKQDVLNAQPWSVAKTWLKS